MAAGSSADCRSTMRCDHHAIGIYNATTVKSSGTRIWQLGGTQIAFMAICLGFAKKGTLLWWHLRPVTTTLLSCVHYPVKRAKSEITVRRYLASFSYSAFSNREAGGGRRTSCVYTCLTYLHSFLQYARYLDGVYKWVLFFMGSWYHTVRSALCWLHLRIFGTHLSCS